MAGAWKFFIVEVTYQIPADQIGATVAEHRAYLQGGYDRGWLLVSGPQVPKVGGMIVARAPSRQALEEFFSQDPYLVQGIAVYRLVEFDPVLRSPMMEDWVTGSSV